MPDTDSAKIRGQLKHPVIDADGHWLELFPIYLEFLGEVAGPAMVDRVRSMFKQWLPAWYAKSAQQRAAGRAPRPPALAFSAEARFRAPSMLPGLFYDSLDEWGIDVALVYPTMALALPHFETDIRRALVRAYNHMVAELFAPYSDRVIPAGICTLNTPQEAIEEAEYAVRQLGLRLFAVNGIVPRTIEADAAVQPDPAKRRIYMDCLGMDSPYDYDPVWKKFIELRIAPTNHEGSTGWPDHSSPTSYVANHLGHFAQANHCFARGLFMGGVTQRFPELNFGFLEGGVGWACSLYSDLCGHWEKYNKPFVDKHRLPTNLDLAEMRRMMERYAPQDKRFLGKIDTILANNLDPLEPDISAEALLARDAGLDEFSRVRIESKADIQRLFTRSFYFGCEADDPTTSWAFSAPFRERGIKPVFGSDISHFDVYDPTEVLAEAWEQVEHKNMTEDDFRQFTFSNVIGLHTRLNPDFFKGTVLEAEVWKERTRLGMDKPS